MKIELKETSSPSSLPSRSGTSGKVSVGGDCIGGDAGRLRWRPLAIPRQRINWHRVFGTSALIVALILVGGSIYLHITQKHRLGRLSSEMFRAAANAELDDSDTATTSKSSCPNAVLPTTTAAAVHAVHAELERKFASNLTEACLYCICEDNSKCYRGFCDGLLCGLYGINLYYWMHGGRPRLSTDNDGRFWLCAEDAKCAVRTLLGYLERYERDCNGDGVIDCRDHLQLHMLGPMGCLQHELRADRGERLEKCLAGVALP